MIDSSQDNRSTEFDIDIKDCALLVIDELGNAEGGPLEDVLLAPTLKTNELVQAAHICGMPVIFTNDAHIPGLDKELLLWGEHGIAGSSDAQVSPQIETTDEDFIIEKRRYSAFFQTGLRLLLDELGVRTLILTGFDTNICVQHTAADAYFNNFNIVVVEDATAAFLIGNQEDGLNYMNKCYAAKIVSADEILQVMKGTAD